MRNVTSARKEFAVRITLFFMTLGAAAAVFVANSLDFLDDNISWEEARPYIILSSLALLALLYIYVNVRKKETAHR